MNTSMMFCTVGGNQLCFFFVVVVFVDIGTWSVTLTIYNLVTIKLFNFVLKYKCSVRDFL